MWDLVVSTGPGWLLEGVRGLSKGLDAFPPFFVIALFTPCLRGGWFHWEENAGDKLSRTGISRGTSLDAATAFTSAREQGHLPLHTSVRPLPRSP